MKLIVFLFVLIIIIVLCYCKKYNNIENFNKKCRRPTNDNPYMNYILYTNDNLEACSNVDSEINTEYLKKIKYDSKNIFDNIISNIHFYTLPSTCIVNNQSKFAKSLYTIKKNCKTDGIDCYK